MHLLRNGWCWHDLACSCQTNKAPHVPEVRHAQLDSFWTLAKPSLPHVLGCDGSTQRSPYKCMHMFYMRTHMYINTCTIMYYYFLNHWSSQSSQTKKTRIEYSSIGLYQCKQFLSAFWSHFHARLVDQAIEIVESNHSALALSQDHYSRGRAGKGYGLVWGFMAIHRSIIPHINPKRQGTMGE